MTREYLALNYAFLASDASLLSLIGSVYRGRSQCVLDMTSAI